MQPRSSFPHFALAAIHERQGVSEKAYAAYHAALALSPVDAEALGALDDAYETGGLRAVHRHMLEAPPTPYFESASSQARFRMLLGDRDGALQALGRSVARREAPWIVHDPLLAVPQSGHPAFEQLVAHVRGIVPAWSVTLFERIGR